MASTQDDELSTDVYQDGTEKAVRSTSQYSRTAHIPKTDDDANVVTDADDFPVPECGTTTPTADTDWVLRSVDTVSHRAKCKRCFESDDVADQNQSNAGSKTFARKMVYGDDWGE